VVKNKRLGRRKSTLGFNGVVEAKKNGARKNGE